MYWQINIFEAFGIGEYNRYIVSEMLNTYYHQALFGAFLLFYVPPLELPHNLGKPHSNVVYIPMSNLHPLYC
jgi:hypothetical protein